MISCLFTILPCYLLFSLFVLLLYVMSCIVFYYICLLIIVNCLQNSLSNKGIENNFYFGFSILMCTRVRGEGRRKLN